MTDTTLATEGTKQIVDPFLSGFSGEDVLVTVSKDHVDTNDDLVSVDAPIVPSEEVPTGDDEGAAAAPSAGSQYEELTSTLNLLKEKVANHDKRMDDAFGRIGSVQEFVKRIQTQTPAGETVPELTDEDMAEFRKELPSMTDDMKKLLNIALKKVKGTGPVIPAQDVQGEVRNVIATERGQIVGEVTRQIQRDFVLAEHSDFDDVIKTPEFKEFIKTKPREVQLSWSPPVVIKTMNEFKSMRKAASKSTQAGDEGRASVLSAGVNPKGAGVALAKGPKHLSDEDQFNAGFNGE